ncbi:uncharacterized protein [Amphiura filiformis]|uniref:uncharacterized protein n=1 Tax=Amphiura filiformis TaxID=82378 RepID=UPI003B22354A
MGRIEECKEVVLEVMELKTTGETSAAEPLSHRYPKWFATRNTISAFLKIEWKPEGRGATYFDPGCCDKPGCKCKQGVWRLLDKMAPLPYPRREVEEFKGCSLVVVDGKLYAAGGMVEDNTPLGNFCVYDSSANKWKRLPPMKSKRAFFPMVAHQGYIYALGGFQKDGAYYGVERYSLRDKKWERFGGYGLDLAHMSAVSFKGRIVLCGTMANLMQRKTLIVLALKVKTPEWDIVSIRPYEEGIEDFSPVLIVLEDKLYVVSFEKDMEELIRRPHVQEIKCLNFDCDDEKASVDIDVVSFYPGIFVKAFSAQYMTQDGDIYVSKYQHAKRLESKKDSSGENYYSVGDWFNLALGQRGSTVLFTFKKQQLSTIVH